MIQPPTLHKQTRVVMTSAEILFLFFPPSFFRVLHGTTLLAVLWQLFQVLRCSFRPALGLLMRHNRPAPSCPLPKPLVQPPPEWATVKLQFSNHLKPFKAGFEQQTRKCQFKVSPDPLISTGDNDAGVTGWADL